MCGVEERDVQAEKVKRLAQGRDALATGSVELEGKNEHDERDAACGEVEICGEADSGQ